MSRKLKLPAQVAEIYRAIKALQEAYPGRRFTPDGHLVGSLGEVAAAEALNLKLYPMSHRKHDAFDDNGDVQIKTTAGNTVSMYDTCQRLVVLQIISAEEAEIVYDGPGEPAWKNCGKAQKNGQRSISLAKLRRLDAQLKSGSS